ncbi:hypothetical protein GCM10011587_11520 [Pyruvatibacter mobilis]|nr:hypothetical protein GCM10011587_11520 [Pyruvatibacter mobilis]
MIRISGAGRSGERGSMTTQTEAPGGTGTTAPDREDGGGTGTGTGSPARVAVLCHADNLRASLAHAFGPGYASVNPQALAERLAAERGWDLARLTVYASSDPHTDNTSDTLLDDTGTRAAWLKRVGGTSARLTTQPGDVTLRMALDGTAQLRDRNIGILMVMGAGPGFMALAQDTRTAARQQNRDIRFASAFAPSSHPHGRAVPSADLSVSISRALVEKCLFSAGATPPSPRRIYAGRARAQTAEPAAPALRLPRLRPLRALYGVGFAGSVMALVWEDVVAAGGHAALAWDSWRWGVSLALAAAKSLLWPLYWLARALGIEAGG